MIFSYHPVDMHLTVQLRFRLSPMVKELATFVQPGNVHLHRRGHFGMRSMHVLSAMISTLCLPSLQILFPCSPSTGIKNNCMTRRKKAQANGNLRLVLS